MIGAHLNKAPTMVFFSTPEKNLNNTESAMIIASFDPTFIPSSLQNPMGTIETKRESKVPNFLEAESDY
jgi:hypothetical protein